ncbi:uncharacterized protein [Hoplias malabaricus]|uniref:uncharacterized protein n=1 Tax=Hoplias malabaricus TaxID=27720 RepID=UPI00346194AA
MSPRLLRDYLCIMLLLSTSSCKCHKMQQDEICKSTCSASLNVLKGQRHTYRYSTTISSSLKGPSPAVSQLAFDCVVDIDVLPECPDMVIKIRNPQIKQSSLKKDNSVLRLKSIREALEKTPLRFQLQGGKVTALCPQEAEQVWTLNIKRALLSMLQTSHSGRAREKVRETDVYGTCISSYEQNGPSVVKTRHLQQCLRDRVNDFWWQSVPQKEDMTVNVSLRCTQLFGTAVMDKVNCTESVVIVPLSGSLDVAQTVTVSTLTLLRTLQGIKVRSGFHEEGCLTDLRFKVEASRSIRDGSQSVQEISSTVRRLCAHSADQQQQSDLFLSLAVQLRALTLQQLKDVWQEVSFKCRNDWQPLMEALPSCGSEACVHFSTNLILNNEADQNLITSFLSSITFTPHPTASMISNISVLLKLPQVRLKTMLALSSLVHHLCQREQTPCSQINEIQQFVDVLKENLALGCGEQGSIQITELLYVLKAVENIGLAAVALIPQLADCIQNHSAPVELRLAAVHAFRRIPCHSQREVLVLLYRQPHEDVEVRIAAYLQLMNCPGQEVFRIIRDTLKNETSSQVGSFVWSHLFNIQKSEDPLKKDLAEALPHDIISKDFETETWKYSSYMDYTMDAGQAIANIEGALVFSPKSFLPRSAMTNVTVHIMGRSFNLLEFAFRMENSEPFLWKMFEGVSPTEQSGGQKESASHGKKRNKRSEEKWTDQKEKVVQNEDCKSSILSPIKAKFTGQREKDSDLQCWINIKMFGTDLTFMTCNELLGQLRELSLSVAGFTVKLLQGQEVKVNHRSIVLAEELVLPSLSGLPIKLGINMSTFYSLWLKGSASFKDWSQFSLAGYIKPNAFVGLWARMGVDGAFGRVGLEWVTQVRTSTSLDGGLYMHNGQSLKMVLNTPEDVMDIVSFSSRVYRVSGESREELTVPRTLKEKTTCTPKTWSKLFGWQLCSDVSYPVALMGRGFPPAGPVVFTLRFQKLDRGLQKYLLEAAYAFISQKHSWLPLEANLLVFLGTPQSTVPRDITLDFSLSPRKLVLKMTHPLKSFLIQGQLEDLIGHWLGKAELIIDDRYHYYLKGLIETLTLPSEKRTHYQLDARMTEDERPVVLAVNVTQGLSRKISISARLKNVFSKDASFSVQLERRQDEGRRQHSVDAGLLLPNLLTTRVLGLVEHNGPEWSSALRVRYSVPDNSHTTHECHMSQNLRDEVELEENLYSLRAEHELQCSHITFINHKIQLRHERSPAHVQSSLDLSYGKHWNQGSNKQRVLLSQSLRNQSGGSLTSYALEFSLRIPEKGLNYRTQLLHSHQKRRKSESSTHLKVNYNDQIPLVAGLHWKDMSAKTSLRKWEGSFSMDTPWVYINIAHKLTQPQHGTTQFTSEITTRKWVSIRNLILEGLYRERNRDREGHLHIFTPTVTYLKVGGWSLLGKRKVNASCSITTAWMPALRGEISLSNGKQLKTLDMSSNYGKKDLKISASLNTLEKKLKKSLVVMSLTLSEANSPYLELEIGGRVEEIRKDKGLYQKRWILHFRQPFQFLPESLLLQETFTIDQNKKVYTLESKALLQENRKALHLLTLGYSPQRPYFCSSLIHSFNLENVPQDSEICFSVHSNQTVQYLQGKMLTAKKEKVVVLGYVQLHGQQDVTIKVNLSQLIQLKLPSIISLDLNLLRKHKQSVEFEYTVNGKVAVDHKDYNAYVRVERSPFGNISSFVHLWSGGEKIASVDVSLANTVQRDIHAFNFDASFQQHLCPLVTADGQIRLSVNSSTDSFTMLCSLRSSEEVFQTQLSGGLLQYPGLQLWLSGDLTISLTSYSSLPHSSSLAGLLNWSEALTEGQLIVTADNAEYGMRLRHSQEDATCGERIHGCESAWMCVLAQEDTLCINISSSFMHNQHSGLQAQLHHSFPWLLSAGLPFSNSAEVYVNHSENGHLTEVGLHTGLKELKLMLQRGGDNSPENTGHFLVKLWANLTDSVRTGQEKPEAWSLSLEIHGHHVTSSTGLTLKVSHNLSSLQSYVPFVFQSKSQMDHLSSSVQATTELLMDSNLASFKGQVTRTKLGFKQILDLYHSLPQLESVPSNILIRTMYAEHNGSHLLTHLTQWIHQDAEIAGSQQRVSGLIDKSGSQVFGWGLEMRLEKEAHHKRANVLLDWTVNGQQEQNQSRKGNRSEIRATGSWTSEGKKTEAILDVQQPFTPTLSHLHLHTLSHSLQHGHDSNNQLIFSWDHGTPVNVSVTVSKHWTSESSRGQACIYVSPGQMQRMLSLVDARGCVSVAEEGKSSYTQSAELKWSDKKIAQSVKYQKGSRGIHSVQIEARVQNVSPGPCTSHSLLAQIQTNLKDFLEHHILLGTCPPQPALSWSGSHRVTSGKDVLYSRMGLSVTGQPLQHSTFILALRNTSSSQRSNYSLLTEWKVGNWSIELGSSGHSSARSTAVQFQAKLDRTELFWMNAALGKRCLHTAVGYDGDSTDDLTMTVCLESRQWLTLKAQRGGSGIENETLTLVSMGIANHSLIVQAKGCEECLLATEARLQQLGAHVKRKLLDRVQKVHHLVQELRRQAGGSVALQELSNWSLRLTQIAEKLLLQRVTVPWSIWISGTLRHTLTQSLPQTLDFIHHMSQLIQQELRKPLATLAEAYQDVTGERLDVAWRQGLELWTRDLEELLPVILHSHQLRAPSLTAFHFIIATLDLVSQQTVHWAEARLATGLVGLRRQLTHVYKFSKSTEEVKLRLPLPQNPWPKGSLSGVVETLLEEFLLKPLMTMNSASLSAELYRLKRRLMDSPFNHQAFVVADAFAVSFDGHLLELPASCDLFLAEDFATNTFTVSLKSIKPKQRSLVVQLRNTTVTIHPNAQVDVDCRNIHPPFTNREVTIMKELNLLTVSNRRGLLVSCDPYLQCSVTLDGWLHGRVSGLLGTNDNEAGNEYPLLDGSQAQSLDEFTQDWQANSSCSSNTPESCLKKSSWDPPCKLLFSSSNSPLSSCFRVIDPDQFLALCERSHCDSVDVSRTSLCRLASAYVNLCHRNYVPLELPIQCA